MTASESNAGSAPRAADAAGLLAGPDAAVGPLVVSKANPRHFRVASALTPAQT